MNKVTKLKKTKETAKNKIKNGKIQKIKYSA